MKSINKLNYGDKIKIESFKSSQRIRGNGNSLSEIERGFLREDAVVLGCHSYKGNNFVQVARTFDVESEPNNINLYILELCNPIFTITYKNKDKILHGDVIIDTDLYGYVKEDKEYVYLIHFHSLLWGNDDEKPDIYKIKKDDYYESAIAAYEVLGLGTMVEGIEWKIKKLTEDDFRKAYRIDVM